MIGKKLYSLLSTFSKTELNQFRKFLESPFFNENEDLVRLFDYLDQHFRQQPAPNEKTALQREKVWKYLYGKSPYRDVSLRRLFSDLNALSNQFLIWQQYQADELEQMVMLLSALNRPNLNKHFSGVVRQIHKQAEVSRRRTAHYHHHFFRTAQLQHQHLEQSGKKIRSFALLEEADYHLDCFYIIQKLKNYCDVLGYQKTLSAEANVHLFPEFLDYLQRSPFLEEPTIRAYFLVTQMMLKPEEEVYFQQLKEMLDHSSERLTASEMHSLFIHLMNYCIDTKINIGRSDYFQELFLLYQLSLKKEIIMDEGVLDPLHYKNIITVGLQIREFEWVESFIQSYTERLPASHQENALNYNLAKVYFHQKEYEKVIELLREVEYANLVYALGAKLMLLKTYFELGEFLALDSLIDSFRIYLRRNKLISRDLKQQYLNVLRFVKKLSSVAPRDEQALARIRKQIQECKTLADKGWILEKLGELSSGS